ncbi:unnamed protein product [Nippostrongylus brasiliensis]|uniref:Activin_recp domain-containing protein n=1 Tax=Nippostrongylus brasiliensis TaxID=27835 RepID=A0A0N4Y5D4_NIPBR|nr:unnamed protein product [Nippostrongylus brasiliensis]
MKDTLRPFLLLLVKLPTILCITCYECTSQQGQECKYTAASCQYGFFGCVKIATYSGVGMFYDQDRHITLMVRGCAILPFGGVDRCEQTSFLGYRIQKCTCFNDYCNSSYRLTQFTLIHILIVIVAWSA